MNIQIIPPAPVVHSSPRFDKWQFAGRRVKAASTASGLSFSDFHDMHVVRVKAPGSHNRKDRSWANSDKTLREVVAANMSMRLNVRINPTLDDFLFANKLFEAKMRRRYAKHKAGRGKWTQEDATGLGVALAAGGLSHALLGVVWRRVRRGLDSVGVAEDMRISPNGARQVIARLDITAEKLAKGTFRFPIHTIVDKQAYLKRFEPRPKWTPERKQLLFTLRQQGVSDREIATQLGMKHHVSVGNAYSFFFGKKVTQVSKDLPR